VSVPPIPQPDRHQFLSIHLSPAQFEVTALAA
jgi:hypothetical protein